jgi:hypothetical protein
MPRNMRFGTTLLAFAIVLLTLMTAVATVILINDRMMLPNDRGPMLKARTLQASYNSTFNITVIDEDGRPIGPHLVGPATVKIVGNTTKPAGWQTDGNGSVVITGVFGNSTGIPYYLSVEATGFQTALKQVVAIENRTTNYTINLVGGVLLGRVSTSAMPPVAIVGATVSILTPSLGPGYSCKTDSTGQYIMKGIPEGQTYYVLANASGYLPASMNVYVPISGSVDFVLTSQTGSISGFVYNSATHAGLNGTNVSVRIGNSITLATSSANGSYEFTDVPPGTYAVTATKIGFNSNTSTGVKVTRENQTILDFNLTEKPILLHGTVRSGTLLLVRANISVVGTRFYSLSGPDGTYEITNLTAGTYTVQASRPGYVTALFVEVIGPGEEKELNVNLTAIPGAILRGIVSTIVGNVKVPLVDVKVTLVTTNITQNSTSTNILGEFAFTGLAPGNYTVLFERADYRPMQVSDITVTNDSASSRQFLMTPLRHGFSGFIFGFDMPHSMMILGLFLTIVILAVAVYLRIRTFQAPGSAPAVYDEVDDEMADGGSADGQGDLEDQLSESKGKGKSG